MICCLSCRGGKDGEEAKPEPNGEGAKPKPKEVKGKAEGPEVAEVSGCTSGWVQATDFRLCERV